MEVDAQQPLSNSPVNTVDSSPYTQMKFSIKDFLGIFNQIHSFLGICSHSLKNHNGKPHFLFNELVAVISRRRNSQKQF